MKPIPDQIAQEFTGRRRMYIVWVKRVTIGAGDWDAIACITRKQAAAEIRRARKDGYMAFVSAYQKAKRTKKDVATEKAAEESGVE